MSNVSTFFGPTMPPPVATVPDLDTVMAVNNNTSYAYYGTGMGMGTTLATGPIVYTPNDGDFTIICDCSSGTVQLDLDPSLPNMFYIKTLGNTVGNITTVFVIGGGSVEGYIPLNLYRDGESVLVVKNGAADYSIVSSHLSVGTLNNGIYTEDPFNGDTITIAHGLNAIPSSCYITPRNSATSSLLAGGYFVTADDTNIIVKLATVAVNVLLSLYTGATRNSY